jgi:hypothetical protein
VRQACTGRVAGWGKVRQLAVRQGQVSYKSGSPETQKLEPWRTIKGDTLKKKFKDITKEELREYTRYDNGVLFWIKDKATCKIGEVCGGTYVMGNGYKAMNFKGVKAALHRFIWLYHNGQYEGDIDHINNDLSDNRIENLRLATRSENLRNRGKFKDCSSKLKGIYWRKDIKKWQASISIGGTTKYLGVFTDEVEAYKAWVSAAEKVQGEFLRCN